MTATTGAQPDTLDRGAHFTVGRAANHDYQHGHGRHIRDRWQHGLIMRHFSPAPSVPDNKASQGDAGGHDGDQCLDHIRRPITSSVVGKQDRDVQQRRPGESNRRSRWVARGIGVGVAKIKLRNLQCSLRGANTYFPIPATDQHHRWHVAAVNGTHTGGGVYTVGASGIPRWVSERSPPSGGGDNTRLGKAVRLCSWR